MKIFTIALLSACIMVTPVMAGTWGCSSLSSNGKQFDHRWNANSKSVCIQHTLAVCNKLGGGACHLVSVKPNVTSKTQARAELPMPGNSSNHWVKGKTFSH